MKKIFITYLLIIFSASNVEARSIKNNYYGHNSKPSINRPSNHHRPIQNNHHTTVIKKKSKNNNLALGVFAGLVGAAIVGNNAQPTYIRNEPIYVSNNISNCVTTVYQYDGTRVTRCYNSPQVNEIVYVR